MIDERGFRFNVGIILANDKNQVFWGRRVGSHDAWQFPQGGIDSNENLEAAMYRELGEELGLEPEHVRILGITKNWLTYFLPHYLRRQANRQTCVGQRQKWFLLRLIAPDSAIRLDHTNKPEFLYWRWEDYWYPIEHVVAFKKLVYKRALHELAPLLLEEKTAC